MATPTASSFFLHDIQFHLLVCRRCEHAVRPGQIVSHLKSLPHRVPLAQARLVQAEVETDLQWRDVQPDRERIEVPVTLKKPVEGLTVFTDGIWCRHSSTCHYVCRGVKTMKNHWRIHHGWAPFGKRGHVSPTELAQAEAQIKTSTQAVCCQRFFKRAAGSQFIRVVRPGAEYEPAPPLPTDEAIEEFRGWWTQEVQPELMGERTTVVQAGEINEANSWLRRAQWTKHLAGVPEPNLRRCVRRPEECQCSHSFLDLTCN